MAAEHVELISEMQALEKMSHTERVRLAKRRRAQQLKVYQSYEKRMEKDSKSTRKSKALERGKSHRGLRFAESTLLFDAAIRNDLEEAESLLKSGVDPNLAGGDSLSVLHQCCLNNLPDMMSLFIRYGADVNARDCDNWTPLHLAATCGNIGLCQCLCENKADLLALNTDGNMPYDLCDDMATLDFIESEMAKRGITQELIDETRLTSENEMLRDLEKFSSGGGDLNFKGPNGETLLHIAACMGYGRVIDFLLKRKVPVNSADAEGWQAHHMATYYGQYHVLESLLLCGADPYARTQTEDTMMDLCDYEAQAKVQALILDVQTRGKKQLGTPSTLDRNNSTRRGSQATLHPGRRSSIHDKATMAHREALMEGQRLQGSIVRAEEEEDDDADSEVIEIPAITVHTAKTPNIKVDRTKEPPKSILKQAVAKTTKDAPKNNLKDSDIWAEAKLPAGEKNSSKTSSDKNSAAHNSGNQSPLDKNSNKSNYSDRKSSFDESPESPKTLTNKGNSSKPNGQPGTLNDLKMQRKMKRETKQSNGTGQGKKVSDAATVRESGKNKKFSNQDDMASGRSDNKCCIMS